MAIKKCTCSHAYQDQKYGSKMRVANQMAKETPTWRCTVCGKEIGAGSTKKKVVNK